MKIGIRREDKNEWERRVPLAPTHIAALVSKGIEVAIQPSSIRVFPDADYEQAGASVTEDLSRCGLVFAVKEIPSSFFRPGVGYMAFSHVAKGQHYNMPMLRRVLECGATLIDYERVTNDSGKRLIFFGNYAGLTGIVETLHALGKRLAWEGMANPFEAIGRPLNLAGLDECRHQLREAADRITSDGLPVGVGPLVVGFAGYGNVSAGAQALFDLLPHEELAPGELTSFMEEGSFSDRKLYKVVFRESDIVRPLEPDQVFDLQDYYDHPQRYRSVFEQYLLHLSVLVNCIYWDERYPRLVTNEWLRGAWTHAGPPRLRVIGDITCDIGGSIECTVRATEPGEPSYTYIPATGETPDGCEGDGPVVMAVETLPAEVPLEASTSFGDMLVPFVPELVAANFEEPFEQLRLSEEIRKAVIVHRGDFTESYRYLTKYV